MQCHTSVFLIFSILITTQCQTGLRQHQCLLSPESSEGNFHLLPTYIRSDIREYRPGIYFELTLTFIDSNTCGPLRDLWVILWQSDALGYYSGYTGVHPHQHLAPGHVHNTDNSTFLRGVQSTDPNGVVRFITVQPGFHNNRARHIHIRTYHKDKSVFTGQLFFEDELSSQVYRVFPYYVQSYRLNSDDPVFNKYNGNQTIISDIQPINNERLTDGLTGRIVIGIDLKSKVSLD